MSERWYEMQPPWPEVAQFREAREDFYEWVDRASGESHKNVFWLEYEAENSILDVRWYLTNEDGNFYVDPGVKGQPAQDRTRMEVSSPPKHVLDAWGGLLVLIKGSGFLKKSG